ncbi:hypothetical protein PoB_001234400 [Plakobranchus ocellatus]|uniref:Uncharacterized protein n=1 Tax=Plakobranchus ocellatus TaxID=259542 RepID=A0AAV3YVS8_9GAST|nr:hypothetical protein PoB_001234400 [Plakobranchus ocellatus]
MCKEHGRHSPRSPHSERFRNVGLEVHRSRSRSQERARHPRDDRCRACGKHGREREHRNRSRSKSRSRNHERAKHPSDDRCRAWGKHGRDREESPRERSHEGKYGRQRSRSSRERSREEEHGELEQQVGNLRSERSRVRRGNRQARRLRKHRKQGRTHQESDRLATAGAGPSLQEREQEDPQLEDIVVPSMIFESTRPATDGCPW